MSEKNQETSDERSERLRLRQAQLRIEYGKVFNSESGKLVLADLKQQFGWQGDIERPSARFGTRPEDVFLTEGMKEPVRHILAMITPIVTTEKKETKAIQ